MKISQMFFKTYREDPADAEIKSHKLLVRAGYIKKQTAGVYIFLPLGLRVLNKIKTVIREEMDKSGANEVLMSSLLPIETFKGRIEHFGSDMFRLTDRTGKELCLGPSHEEVFTNVVKETVNSYKQLPVILYQIQNKFRDEVRPRFGLMRGKEFLMKDAYSFDSTVEGLDNSYNIMSKTYKNIFNRLGLDFVVVDADSGNMGGNNSQEFMVKSEIGEDEIVVCSNCSYSANTEKASSIIEKIDSNVKKLIMEKVKTPSVKTIEDLVKFLGKTSKDFVKSVVYKSEQGIIVALVQGDREIEEVKLCRAINGINVELAFHNDIESIGSVAGFVGAMNLKNCVVVADNTVKNMVNFVIGANETDYHYINANLEDLKIDKFADICKVKDGDICSLCGKPLKIIRGIEVGHIFKFGQKYSKNLDCKFLDENGKAKYMETGSYGIGVTRTISAIIEQMSDDKGIILPEVIAPYKVVIVTANGKDETQKSVAENLYKNLQDLNIEVLYDDRTESYGVKLNDAELIGIPNILVVGRDAVNNKCELICRKDLTSKVIEIGKIIENI